MGTSRGSRGPYKGRSTYGRTTAAGLGAEWRKVRAAVLERDRYVCRYCGAKADTVDHVIPRARGGSNSADNLVAACTSCNSSKGDRAAPSTGSGKPRQRGWYSPGGLRVSRQWLADYRFEPGSKAA